MDPPRRIPDSVVSREIHRKEIRSISRRAERRDCVLTFSPVAAQDNNAMPRGEEFASRLEANSAVPTGNHNCVHEFLSSKIGSLRRISKLILSTAACTLNARTYKKPSRSYNQCHGSPF
jgi:hypothetical protein